MYCYLCSDYAGFNATFCNKCQRLKRIISLYDIDKVLETSEFVFLREKEPINKRTIKVNNNLLNEIREKSDKETKKINQN